MEGFGLSQASLSSGSDWRRSRGVMESDADADGFIVVCNLVLVVNVMFNYSLYGQIVTMHYIN